MYTFWLEFPHKYKGDIKKLQNKYKILEQNSMAMTRKNIGETEKLPIQFWVVVPKHNDLKKQKGSLL